MKEMNVIKYQNIKMQATPLNLHAINCNLHFPAEKVKKNIVSISCAMPHNNYLIMFPFMTYVDTFNKKKHIIRYF